MWVELKQTIISFGYFSMLEVYKCMTNQVSCESQCGSTDSTECAKPKPRLSAIQRTLSFRELITPGQITGTQRSVFLFQGRTRRSSIPQEVPPYEGTKEWNSALSPPHLTSICARTQILLSTNDTQTHTHAHTHRGHS